MKSLHKTETKFLPYGRQDVTQDDIDAVVSVLRSDWLTQGPTVEQFERALAETVGARHAVACSSGTAALHLAMLAGGYGDGDIVVTSPNTFLADASCARYVGAEVIFADIEPDTGNMSIDALEQVLSRDTEKRIRAIIPVHFAGQPIDLVRVYALASAHGTAVIDDACHALGASYDYDDRTIRLGGSPHADMTVYSFHPVKHVAAGEGGAVTIDDDTLAEKLRLFRNHGMSKTDFVQPDMGLAPSGESNPWYYELRQLGYNYRLTDIQCALGLSQLDRLDASVDRRNEIADLYRRYLADRFPGQQVAPLKTMPAVRHAYHLFVVQIDFQYFRLDRATVMNRLRELNIGTQVHYIPVPLQPYYRQHCGTQPGDFPGAEAYYARALSIPMYPTLSDEDCVRVVDSLEKVLTGG